MLTHQTVGNHHEILQGQMSGSGQVQQGPGLARYWHSRAAHDVGLIQGRPVANHPLSSGSGGTISSKVKQAGRRREAGSRRTGHAEGVDLGRGIETYNVRRAQQRVGSGTGKQGLPLFCRDPDSAAGHVEVPGLDASRGEAVERRLADREEAVDSAGGRGLAVAIGPLGHTREPRVPSYPQARPLTGSACKGHIRLAGRSGRIRGRHSP